MTEIRDTAVQSGNFPCVKWCHMRCNDPAIKTFHKSTPECKDWLLSHGYLGNHVLQDTELVVNKVEEAEYDTDFEDDRQ